MVKDTRKIIQALAYLAGKEDDKVMDNMKAFNLLWLADRYHLRQTGMTITGDAYYAMPHGIVPSDAKSLLDGAKTKMRTPRGYKDRYIASKGAYQYMALSDADLKMFSESDIEALDKVYEAYGSMDGKELSDLSHKFPEWTFYRELLSLTQEFFAEQSGKAERYHQYNRV